MPEQRGCQDFGVRAVNEADEQEIETRLRAAFLARGELVTHQLLRPAVPPNEHTAGAKSAGRRRWTLNWRTALVPVSIAAALVGGVFVGMKLPDDKGGQAYSTGSSGSAHTSANAPGSQASTPDHAPNTQSADATQSAAQSTAQPGAKEATFGGLAFQSAGWQLAPLDGASACLLPKAHDAPDKAAVLPCGVDALMIQTAASPDAWPLSTATGKEGWWPKAGSTPGGTNQGTAPAGAVPCPAAKPSAKNLVKSSTPFRADDKYPLAGSTTADFREWAVTCADGSGAVPRLWQIKGTQTIAVTAVSVNARYDGALLQIVASMHPANG